MDVIRGILGMGAAAEKDDFANLNPQDPVAYWRADHDIDQAERAGDVTVAYRKYGIRNESHWEQVQASFYRKHGHTPEYSLAASTANFMAQVEELAKPGEGGACYRMPQEYLAPVEGVGLDVLALAKTRAELQGPGALSAMGMDAAKLGRIEAGWGARMGGSADPTAAGMLNGLYHTYLQQARASLTAGN
ncbi:MAG: hypothetical protein AAF721_00970 [Myxococcota bacterium]